MHTSDGEREEDDQQDNNDKQQHNSRQPRGGEGATMAECGGAHFGSVVRLR